jgi:hypothetical protein
MLFSGYLGDKEATSHAFCGDFYLTGDRATQDEDGYFWFKSRNDDLIISSGYRIGPFEVGFQGVTKRCLLSLLTNSALVIRVQMRGEGGNCGVSANEYSWAHHVTWSPNKLWRSTSIFNLWLDLNRKDIDI